MKQLFFITSTPNIQKPPDWNPNNYKLECVSPGPYSEMRPPQSPGPIGGAWGGSYAVATQNDLVSPTIEFPIDVVNSGNTWNEAWTYIQNSSTYVQYCYAGLSMPQALQTSMPRGNAGGQKIAYGGGGAGGPDGPGLSGGTWIGGKANGGIPYSWYDPDTGQTYHLGDGGDAYPYTGSTWGYGSGGAGDSRQTSGQMNGGGFGLAVISWEPLIVSAAMVAIMA